MNPLFTRLFCMDVDSNAVRECIDRLAGSFDLWA